MDENISEDSLEDLKGELGTEDKSFLLDLVVKEIFQVRDSVDDSKYRCVQSCVTCSRQNTPDLEDNDFVDMKDLVGPANDFSFPIEKRKILMKQVVHEFFKNQWKTRQLQVKTPNEVNSNSSDLEFPEIKLMTHFPSGEKLFRNDIKIGTSSKGVQMIDEVNETPACRTPRIYCRKLKELQGSNTDNKCTSNNLSADKHMQPLHREIKMQTSHIHCHEVNTQEDITVNNIPERVFHEKATKMVNQGINVFKNLEQEFYKRQINVSYENVKEITFERSEETVIKKQSKRRLRKVARKMYKCNGQCRQLCKHNFSTDLHTNECIFENKQRRLGRINEESAESYYNANNVPRLDNEIDCYKSPRRKIYSYEKQDDYHIEVTMKTSRYSVEPQKCVSTNHIESESFPIECFKENRKHSYSSDDLKQTVNYKCQIKRFKGAAEGGREKTESFKDEPVNDIMVAFCVDREKVNVEVYQDGLANKGWNPSQVLYEICTQSQWSRPEFHQVMDAVPGGGFLWSVKVEGVVFTGARPVSTKRIARHLASTQCLHDLGFCFHYDGSNC